MSYVYHTLIGTFDGWVKLMLQDFDSYTDVSHSTTGLPYEVYFLCDLFNIEYVHFIKRNQRNWKSCKSRDAIINSFLVVLAVRGLTLGTSGASEIFLMQMPGMV
jgi:hypothetical protein